MLNIRDISCFFPSGIETRLEIKISTGLQVQKRPLSTDSGRCYRIYSPEKVVLRPLEVRTINLNLKIKFPDGTQKIIALLPTFIEQSLTLGNSKRGTSQTWNETIRLKLLNRNFHCTATINKNEEIARLFLLHGPRNESVTLYKLTC